MDIGQKNKDVADINVGDKSISCSHENDLISRRAAIYIASGYCHPANIAKELAKLPPAELDTYWKEQCQSYEQTINKLRESLSTQPEIIRCKDCKHRDKYGCCKHWKGLAMGDIPIATDDNDFCSYAKRKNDVSNER